MIPPCFGMFPPPLSSQSSALEGIKNDDPSVERSFLHVHLGDGKSTMQWVEGWTAPVKKGARALLGPTSAHQAYWDRRKHCPMS